MVAFSSSALISAAVAILYASGAASAPTPSTNEPAAVVARAPGVTHTVVAGLGGLHFDPDNVVANIGDIVEYHYLPKNHSVAQSSFGKPCVPINGNAFFSGFMATAEGQNPKVFTITVNDTNPIWFYCSQTNGNHCQNGMAGVINQNFNSPNTLRAYKAAAALTNTSISPPHIGGGVVKLNPNPLGGF